MTHCPWCLQEGCCPTCPGPADRTPCRAHGSEGCRPCNVPLPTWGPDWNRPPDEEY